MMKEGVAVAMVRVGAASMSTQDASPMPEYADRRCYKRVGGDKTCSC